MSTKFCPLVSVIVPLFNGSMYIESCLRSILAQTYDKYEIIVVNDGSTDDSMEKVEDIYRQFPDRIRIVYHPDHRNHGIAASRNCGIIHARGEYIAFLDQDDLWIDEKLRKQIDVLRNYPETPLVYAKTMFIDEKEQTISVDNKFAAAGRGYAEIPKNVFKNIITENFIPTLTVLVLKNSLIKYGCFEEGPRHEYEDWLLWSKMAYSEKFLFLPEVLSKYRLHSENYSFFRLKSGLDTKAEEHYIITLYKYLLKDKNCNWEKIHRFFRKSIFRFFIRARSYGVSKNQLEAHKNKLLEEFPEGVKNIQTAFMVAKLLNPRILYVIRRIYRIIIRI